MSESDSDIEFESADEGEESELKRDANKILVKKEYDSERLQLSAGCEKDTNIANIKEENLVLTENSINKNKTTEETVKSDVNPLNIELKDENVMDDLNKKFSTERNVKNENLENAQEITKNSLQDLEDEHSKLDWSEEKSALFQNVKTKPSRVKLRFEERLEKNQKKAAKSPDHREKEVEVLKKLENLTAKEENNSGWGWGGWKSSILSTAASSVSVFTSQVSQGLGTVLETVEATLGAPSPEELAASIDSKTEKENDQEKERKMEQGSSGLFEGVSSLTKVIENTGSKVIMGGLDTLELIGKKTIDILTEGDPGFRKKRSYFSGSSLSEVLKEAKEKEVSYDPLSEKDDEKSINYSVLFDNFQGIAYLEALELLSRQNKSRVQEFLISESDRRETREECEECRLICEDLLSVDDALDEDNDHEFVQLIEERIDNIKLDVNITGFLEVQKRIRDWLEECKKEQEKTTWKEPKEIYAEAMKSLAEFTARSVELYKRMAESLLIRNADDVSSTLYAKELTEMSKVLCLEVRIVANRFSRCLNAAADDSLDPDSATPLITSIYLEASNSSTYIQDAFQLLIPTFQAMAIERSE
ncbi:protein FAM114A2 [Centruroides vittatus]|uniref:protein FAM114A2 n=1 Tax=Centruroides vittatus TaxID=120091 RepID=UPI00350FE3B4